MGMIKTEKELQLLRKSAAISNSCLKIIESALREGVTERELARRVRNQINARGASLSFQTLVGSGPRAAMVHTHPHVTDQKISGMGYIDFGAKYKGYHSDVTVPFVKGGIGSEEKNIIETGLAAYRIATESVRLGEPCWKLHEKVYRFLRSKGYTIPHSLGHGLGLKIHERPIIGMPMKKLEGKRLKRWRRIQKVTFQPNMVFTIEPGIYVKNHGGFRIENDFLLTRHGLEVLTKSRLIRV